MTFTVNLSARAETDVDGILAWLQTIAPGAMAGWYNRIITVIQTLEYLPTRCPLAQNHPHSDSNSANFFTENGAVRSGFYSKLKVTL